jgi:hypothetical protein
VVRFFWNPFWFRLIITIIFYDKSAKSIMSTGRPNNFVYCILFSEISAQYPYEDSDNEGRLGSLQIHNVPRRNYRREPGDTGW